MSDEIEPGESTVLDKVKLVIVDHKHPIWRTLNVLVVSGFVLLYAAINAQNFDETELHMFLQFIVTMIGYEGAKAAYSSAKK